MLEHQQCCRFMALAGMYDQLDVTNLACLEAVARRLQTIEYQYRERVRDSDQGTSSAGASMAGQVMITADEAELFAGSSHVASTICCAPALVEHVSRELEKEARVAKETRKAREERALLRRTPPPGEETGKGGGKKK